MIFRSPYPDVQIPALPVTEYVLHNAAQYGEKPALIDGPSGRTLTYAQLTDAIQRAAAALSQLGFSQGNVLAIYSPNLPEYAVAFHAVATLGGVNTTINPLYTTDELAQQLIDSGARYLLTIPPLLDKAKEAAAKSGVEELLVFGEANGATSFASLLEDDGVLPTVQIDPATDLVALPYSSGTSGFPKGVMLTHRNLVANMVQMEGITDAKLVEVDDTVMGILPFYHIYGMVVIMNYTLAKGATVVTMPRFDMEQFLQLIQDYRVTRMNLVPPIILGLARYPLVDKFDLSSLKYITSGAAPLSADLAHAAATRLNCIVMQGYGLTETSPVTHVCPDYKAVDNPGTIGPSLPNTEVIVADVATQQSLGIQERGEIWIRGPQVMKGYLNNPQATAACIDEEGWLHTGDIGYADAESYFYIVDRVKELIKYKGFQVAPAELEALLMTHPAVGDVAVIPSPDEVAGEVPKAFVVRKGDLNGKDLMAWVAARVSPHKRIRRLEFVDEIPKSASGKILRRVLVERERANF